MKKTLIALAALASTAAFAQVTIDGTVDVSYMDVSSDATANAAVGTTLANGNQGTTGISFRASEDLGGGLKANFRYEANFDASSGDNGLAFNSDGASGEVFVGLQGSFGTVQFGKPNTHTLAVQGARHPFGTKVGGGYGGATGKSYTRQADSIKYTSPAINGFTFGATHQLKDSASPAGSAWTEVAAFYAAGPFKAGFSNVTQNNDNMAQTNLSASYDFGPAVLMGGMHTQDAVGKDSSGYNIAISVPLGAVTLLGNFASEDHDDYDRTTAAVGAKYAFSKRTSAYGRYVLDEKKASSAIDDTYFIVGLQHNF